MIIEARRIYWKNLVDQYAQSGLSAKAFCLENSIKLQQFYRWRRIFRKLLSQQTEGFIELIPSLKDIDSGIRIRLYQDISIEIDRSFDPGTLRAVQLSMH